MPYSPGRLPVTCITHRGRDRGMRALLAVSEGLVRLCRLARELAFGAQCPAAVEQLNFDLVDQLPELLSRIEARHIPCLAAASRHERAEDVGKDSRVRPEVFARLH